WLRRFRLAGRRLRLALRDLDAFVLDQTAELAGEAREPSAAVDELLLTAGPGRVRLRVDLELHRVARLAPGRARRVFGAIRHDDFDRMIVGVNPVLHS